MSISTQFAKKKYYWNIFLKPLALAKKTHVVYHKLKNYFISRRFPSSLVLGVTYRCQLDCSHCGIENCRKSGQEELSKEEIKGVIRQAHRLGVYFIVFSGGEPLLREDICELVNFVASEGLVIAINTNGLLLTTTMLSELKRAGLTFINISLDGAEAEHHHQLRRAEGCFDKTIKAIKACGTFGISVFVSVCATKENIHNKEIEKIIILARTLGAKGVKITLATPVGKWLHCPEVQLSKEERLYVASLLDPTYVFVEGVLNTGMECNSALKKICYVSPYGEVQPCIFVPLYFGNVRSEPLRNIWQIMTNHALYRIADKGECIISNEYFRKQFIDNTDKHKGLPVKIIQ
ncbi:MAG: radical SAM protein [Candidatus Omnitrophota bacterium]